MANLLEIKNLKKYFPVRSGLLGFGRKWVQAVDRVSFTIAPGETLGLVGESGCGKTTIGRTILRLTEPTGGKVFFQGTEITALPGNKMRLFRPKMQIVFQDPYSSLNPRMVVLDLVGEGLRSKNAQEKKDLVVEVLERVGLSSGILYHYPHEFSGGQRQRIAIARAIVLHPELLVCDEAASALDVSIQAQIINLLIKLRQELKMAYLFISHDLAVVKHISHRVAVMYLGQIMEIAPTKELFDNPLHPYTQALLAAVPVPDPEFTRERLILPGEPESAAGTDEGCRFAPRCPHADNRCRLEEPPLIAAGDGHRVKCFHVPSLLT